MGEQLAEFTPLEDRLLLDPMTDKAISLTYRKLMNNSPYPLKELWEWGIGLIDNDDWVEAVQSPREVDIWANFRLIQLGVLHKLYYFRSLLQRMGRCDMALCARGCGMVGFFFHILWECPETQQYWRGLGQVMGRVTGLTVPLEARWLLLNIMGKEVWSKFQRLWLALGAGVAKRNISRVWGAGRPPRVAAWELDLDWCQKAEQVVYQT